MNNVIAVKEKISFKQIDVSFTEFDKINNDKANQLLFVKKAVIFQNNYWYVYKLFLYIAIFLYDFECFLVDN